MNVRAKFKVEQITKYNHGHSEIILRPVYSDDPNHENKKFWDATPSGELKLGLNKASTADTFELGKEYYLDFSPAG